jgi:RHS repeat-associated protein
MQCAIAEKIKNSTAFRGDSGQNATKTVNSGIATCLYYYGARYLDPRASRWISTDPAMAEYIPQAPINDDAKKHNQNLPGMGGIFNTVNMHVYHYAGNNPVKLVDPDGRNLYNGTNDDIIVIPEGGDESYTVHSGEMYEGPIDGVMLKDGTIIKVTNMESLNTRVSLAIVTEEGEDKAYIVYGDLINKAGDLGKIIKAEGDLLSGIYRLGDDHYNELRKDWDEKINNKSSDPIRVRSMTDNEISHYINGNGVHRWPLSHKGEKAPMMDQRYHRLWLTY